MKRMKQPWVLVLLITVIAGAIWTVIMLPDNQHVRPSGPAYEEKFRDHMDHSALLRGPFETGQDVTRACLECHPAAATEIMATSHWNWVGNEVKVPGHDGKTRIGKRNLLNNFCIGIQGNWASCTKCHAGYGWTDDDFDFKDQESVDCLVCHDGTGTYVKAAGGLPGKDVDLLAVAKSVGAPKRNNCGYCHNFGGGGMGVKHGDLDASLNTPTEMDDVHMGRHGFLCVDCHTTKKHDIKGTSMSVGVNRNNGIFCENCHTDAPHVDERLNAHLNAVACETCHIPSYARRNPTKVEWDWSKAGDDSRPDDVHHYLKIKGEFVYDSDVVPLYRWYNGKSARYLIGDKIDPAKVTDINRPLGSKKDPDAKIHPFKIHYAKQPYDAGTNELMVPTTAGKGGYWHEFNWDKAMRLGGQATGQAYSGKFGFAKTQMFWPLSHMVTPKENAVTCEACHSTPSIMNWEELGYDADPIVGGGR